MPHTAPDKHPRKGARGPDDELRERLERIISDHSQAEVAHKTGEPRQNIYRYLKGTKMPASFCASLVNEFGVNPFWLLTGEGVSYQAAVSERAEGMSSNMLELVRALSSVAKVRLGALTGRRQQRVVRELRDALEQEETLRGALNEQSAPVFREVLRQYSKLLSARDMDVEQAGAVRQTAEQLARICSDNSLRLLFDELRSRHEFNLKNSRASIDFQWQAFLRTLGGGMNVSAELLSSAINLGLGYVQAGEMESARTLFGICLALIGTRKQEHQDAYLYASMLLAAVEVELGDMTQGIARMRDAYPLMNERFRTSTSGPYVRALLLSGVLRVHEAMDVGARTKARAAALFHYAIWLEQRDVLELVCSKMGRKQPVNGAATDLNYEDLPENAYVVCHARALLALLDSGRCEDYAIVMAHPVGRWSARATDAVHAFAGTVLQTQFLRLAGELSAARASHRTSERLLGGFPPEGPADVVLAAMHHRNSLELCRPDRPRGTLTAASRRATQFFDQFYANGYLCFHQFVSAP